MAIVVGTTFTKRMIKRLSQMFVFLPSNPSITACPARVPVTEDAIPEERRVTTKTTAAQAPNSGINVLNASDMDDICELLG